MPQPVTTRSATEASPGRKASMVFVFIQFMLFAFKLGRAVAIIATTALPSVAFFAERTDQCGLTAITFPGVCYHIFELAEFKGTFALQLAEINIQFGLFRIAYAYQPAGGGRLPEEYIAVKVIHHPAQLFVIQHGELR